MSNKTGVLDEAADGIRTMLSRLGEFFHIFDLSFVVSGATTFAALWVLCFRLDLKHTFSIPAWIIGFGIIIACYVMGLLSFSFGRLLNGWLFRRRNVLIKNLKGAVTAHGLRGELIDRYLQSDALLWQLYIRLWQELADKHPASIAFTHLSRYWAMAATYDGLAVSLLAWALVLTPLEQFSNSFLGFRSSIATMMILVTAALLCFWQAGKFYKYQIEDLVAALVVMKTSFDVESPP